MSTTPRSHQGSNSAAATLTSTNLSHTLPHNHNHTLPHNHNHSSSSFLRDASSHQGKPLVISPNHHLLASHHASQITKLDSLATSHKQLMMGVPPVATPLSHQTNGACTSNDSGHSNSNHNNHNHISNTDTDTNNTPHTNSLLPAKPAATMVELKGKAKEVDPIADLPLAQLEAELPREKADLIPLAALVERLANYGYESLQNLAETLQSLPSSARRAKIFTAALDARKQFIKLLVLVRWSRDVADLQKARNIISLLAEQQWQHEDVFAGLTEVRKILPNARIRNADLPTAVDVLRTGSYRRLPESLKDMVVSQKPFTDDEAIDIVTQLQDALRIRMACYELVPAPMTQYHIRDGKVHVKVSGFFEAQLTASGTGQAQQRQGEDEPSEAIKHDPLLDRWWLLDLKFDINITGSNSESAIKLFPRNPPRDYKERLRIWGDRELEPKTKASDTEEPDPTKQQPQITTDLSDTNPETHDPAHSVQKLSDQQNDTNVPKAVETQQAKDAPLVRLFMFLQERSLHYQLDILQYQATELARLNWGSNLRVEWSQKPRSLTLHYWTKAQHNATVVNGSKHSSDVSSTLPTSGSGPAMGGSIHITIADESDKIGTEKVVADLLNDVEVHTDEPEKHPSEREPSTLDKADTPKSFVVKRRKLKVVWTASPSIKGEVDELLDLVIDPHNLNVESLLACAVQKHTAALLRILQRRILVSSHALSKILRPQDCKLCSTISHRGYLFNDVGLAGKSRRKREYLLIDLQGTSRDRISTTKESWTVMPPLQLAIDPISGRIQLESDAGSTVSDLEQENVHDSLLSSFSAQPLAALPTMSRLTEASERINGSIDVLSDVLYRLEIFARVEEWERKASYIGLRTLRKLNLRPQEYAKFGPSIVTCGPPVLYIPLGTNVQGYFLALQPSEVTGVNVALICVAQTIDGSAPPLSVTLQLVEWLDRIRIAKTALGESDSNSKSQPIGKRKRADSLNPEDRSAEPESYGQVSKLTGTGDLSLEELASLHSYCIARVSYIRIEQQLRARAIPYLHVGNMTSRPDLAAASCSSGRKGGLKLVKREDGSACPATAVDTEKGDSSQEDVHSGASRLVPTLCVGSIDLLSSPKAHLAKRNISIRVCEWWDRDRIQVQILVKLRMKSRKFRFIRKVVDSGNTDGKEGARTWIEFDNHTSILKYTSRDLDSCISNFCNEWDRLSKPIELAREVLNVGRMGQRIGSGRKSSQYEFGIKGLELKRFSLSDVIFAYGWTEVTTDPCSNDREDGKPTTAERRRLLVRVRWQEPDPASLPFGGFAIGGLYSHGSSCLLEFGSCHPNEELDHDRFSSDRDLVSSWFTGQSVQWNPHNAMAFELKRTINVAAVNLGLFTPTSHRPMVGATSASVAAAAAAVRTDRIWRGFFQLLQDTLPLIRQIGPYLQQSLQDAECPELEIRSATWFRLRFLDRYVLDIRLLTRSRFLLCDASQPLFRSPIKGLDIKRVPTTNQLEEEEDDLFTGFSCKPKSYSHSWTSEQSTHQHRAIPNFNQIIQQVSLNDDTPLSNSNFTILDLGRALLCSTKQDVVEKIFPLLVSKIQQSVQI